MFTLFSAVFIASLVGSTHCAGMCGAFVAFAVGTSGAADAKPVSRRALAAAYNGGRLVTYVTLGCLAGSLGAALDLGGSLVGVQRAAMIGAASIMIGFGVIALLRQAGVRVPRMPLPGFMVRAARAGHTRAMGLSPVVRAGAIGLMTTLLPCGWLYAFVITAAGTAHPLYGAGVMAAFWMGTLPILVALGLGVRMISGPLERRLPLISSLLLVAAGLWTIGGRAVMPAISAESLRVPVGAEATLESVNHSHEVCPLCREAGK